MTVIKSTTGGQDMMIMAIVWLATSLSVILHKISLQSLLKLPKEGRISCNQGLCLTLSFFFTNLLCKWIKLKLYIYILGYIG